ncbi:MAG: aminoglycoside phosphotransferase [Gammaproteobacteria bacterium]|nr:MAG: aminoglycoside phosphotransferase [Gammaproteobacteria bacterium]TND06770.1 MAG: aminoglycoside phosphotransferase [Gammaproteobacteria bacterium]
MNTRPTLILSLQHAELYDHPVTAFAVIETHISWVILTGPFAYKIKKPVNLGFLDFSSLQQRRHCCEAELRLNRRLAPQLYLDIVSITGSVEAPRLNGDGEPIEYAVRMKQFPQALQLDKVLASGGLRPDHIDQLADTVARFHAALPAAGPDSRFGTPETVYRPVMENFAQIRPVLALKADVDMAGRLESWSKNAYSRHLLAFQDRKATGFIRECHGDMHLANMVLLDDTVTVFDCLEFSEALRWIDVASEIAFVTMDLDDRNQRTFSARFLNRYLEHTGDYDGLRVMRFYQVYRAMVRAKVSGIRAQQDDVTATEKSDIEKLFRSYLALAEQYTRPAPAALIITHGLSGSGKTVFSQPLLEKLGAVRIRSDVERKRLAGMGATDRAGTSPDSGLYNAASSKRTYDHLAQLATRIIEAGFPAIVDATFLKRESRAAFRRLATLLDVPFVIIDFHAPEQLLRQWIADRAQHGQDASDANVAVLEQQIMTQEPLTRDEGGFVIRVDTSTDVDTAMLAAAVQARTRDP